MSLTGVVTNVVGDHTSFGVGIFCLLIPSRVVVLARRRWETSGRATRGLPALVDAVEARLFGGVALLVALILADAAR